MSKKYDRKLIRAVHLVPLTAFDESGRINRPLQEKHISRMYAAGMRVYMPAAGTSEFHSLSADEIVEIIRITRQASGPDAQIFAPLGFQIGHSLDVAARSVEAGATGVMFMPFAHPYLCDVGVKDYIEQVLEKVPVPALIYKKGSIPSDKLLLELAHHPQVVGIKYAVNEMHDFRKVVQADNDHIEWICGTAERYAPYYMLAGSTGFTTGAGNICPHLSLAMHAAFSAGEWEEGMRLQQIILPIEDYRARQGDSYNISMLKHGMKLLGEDFGEVRAPQRKLTSEEKTEIELLLKPIIAAENELQGELASVGLSR